MNDDELERLGVTPASDPEYFELLSEVRRLCRCQRPFKFGVGSGAAVSVALVFLGEFWIGLVVAAISTVLSIVWLEVVREPRRRYNARNTARREAFAARRQAGGRHPDL